MRINVLDIGYVELIETWGTGKEGTDDRAGCDYEVGIIEAARQSTQGGFRGWDDDAKLLGYLYRNQHMTPFEFAGLVIEVRAPLMVFREWQRHRTQSYNEMSARYAPLPDMDYYPDVDRIMLAAGANKQAGAVTDAKELTVSAAEQFKVDLLHHYRAAEELYQRALHDGIPKELARLHVTMGRYSQMRAAGNLRNWLAFMTLRCDPKAQWEIRQYAFAVETIIAHCFPHTHELWQDE